MALIEHDNKAYLHTYAAQRMCSDEMWTELLDTLKRYEETHELFLLTHTPGDKRFLEQQLGFKRVDDHPLCYLTKTNSRALKQNSNVQEYRAEVLRTRMRLVGSGSASTSGSVARSISTSSNGNGYINGKSVTKRRKHFNGRN